MKLVEIDDNTQVDQQQPSDDNFTAPRILSTLDNSMNAILNRHDINDIEKWAQYNQILHKYLHHLKKKNTQQMSPSVELNRSEILQNTPEAFRKRISDLNMSGLIPMKSSIDSITQPSVREFFERAKLSDVNFLDPNGDEFNSNEFSDLDNSLNISSGEAMSIAEITPEKSRNVTQRGRKRAHTKQMTGIHPLKVVPRERPDNLQPTQLFRNRQQTQSNMEFYWRTTDAN